MSFVQKRKLPDWMLCRERIVHNPVSLFTQAFVCIVRTAQSIELRDFKDQLSHSDPVNVVFEGGCHQEECWKQSRYSEHTIHNHLLPTSNFVFYNPYFVQNIQHVYSEKFDYVPLSQKEIHAKEKAKFASNWYRNSQLRRSDKSRRSKRKLLF